MDAGSALTLQYSVAKPSGVQVIAHSLIAYLRNAPVGAELSMAIRTLLPLAAAR